MSEEMDPYFRDAFEGLREAAQHLMAASAAIATASDAINAAGAALVRTVDAVLHAKHEHEDLRETVGRLEHLIIEQGGEIHAMRQELQDVRQRLNGHTDG